MFETIAFYLFSIITVAMFTIVVTTKNALYAMSALAAGMIMISGFFFLLGADFLGVVQIIVYTGAVMALYAFGMMFMDTTRDVKEKEEPAKLVYGMSILSAVLVTVIAIAPILGSKFEAMAPMSAGIENTNDIGLVLFTKYLVPFEVAAVMLLVAMIAGIVLVSKSMDDSITLNEEIEAKGEFEELDELNRRKGD
jgi:NADH-quinone oxidoreductase subunit J